MHITDFPPDKEGRYICWKCHEASNTKNKVKHLDPKAPRPTAWRALDGNTINHEILGRLVNNGGEWTTEPLKIGAFGYTCPIILSADDESPSESHFAAAVNILQSSEAFRDEVAARMADEYGQHIRPQLATRPDSSSLPELTTPGDIWKVITGLENVFIEEESVSLSFGLTFDQSHEFAVRLQDGEFYEVMLDG